MKAIPVHEGRTPPRAVLALAAWLCAAGAFGCGGSGKRVAQPGEFTEQHAVIFDDGVDLIEDPDSLQGRWRTDFEVELDQRFEDADLVAHGKVTTVREEIDPESNASFHLLFRVGKTYKGSAGRDEISLAAREGAAGYASVAQHRQHIMEREMVVFVRRAVGEDGAVTPHFHLMPPSPAVTRGLKRYDARQHPNRITVIEHKQK
jgi:hypothetical protein